MISASPGCSVFDQPVEVPKMVKHDQGSPKLGRGPTIWESRIFLVVDLFKNFRFWIAWIQRASMASTPTFFSSPQ
jgi:hypothetical protein